MALRHHRPYEPTRSDRAIAVALGANAAWLSCAGEAFSVCEPPTWASTPVLSLVQAIWALDPERAHARLRSRLLATSEEDPFDRSLVQLAAKRLALVPCEGARAGEAPDLPRDLGDLLPAVRQRAVDAIVQPPEERLADPRDLDRWEQPAASGLPLALRDRSLLAALLDPAGRVILAARNAAGRDRTRHAELNLVQALWYSAGSRLPAGSRLVCSLKPCRMCASMITRSALGPIEVLYLRDDPGRLASGTQLDRLGWQRMVDE